MSNNALHFHVIKIKEYDIVSECYNVIYRVLLNNFRLYQATRLLPVNVDHKQFDRYKKGETY